MKKTVCVKAKNENLNKLKHYNKAAAAKLAENGADTFGGGSSGKTIDGVV